MQEKKSDFYSNIDSKFDSIYSRGFATERSFWMNVGRVVNKQAIFERGDQVFDNFNKNINSWSNNYDK